MHETRKDDISIKTPAETAVSAAESQPPAPQTPRGWAPLRWVTGSRFGGLYLFGAVFMIVSLILRAALLIESRAAADFSAWVLLKTFAVGAFFDVATYCCIAAFFSLVLALIPDRVHRWLPVRVLLMVIYAAMLGATMFDVAAELLFWDEFSARFNFVAVDYLVYTQEVVGNIQESYPLATILGRVFVAMLLALAVTGPLVWRSTKAPSTWKRRFRIAGTFLAAAACTLLFVNLSQSRISRNQYNNELAQNGFYSLVAAFYSNTINYDQFYLTADDGQTLRNLRPLLEQDNARFTSEEATDITRQVTAAGPEKRCNVVLIVVESLSAHFLGTFGDTQGLTPNLDELCGQSLLFRNLYATGTRTVRGLEAITLSLPPTPGHAMVKRPDNAGLFSLGPIFAQRGYDNKFLYGGYGYFDNMNAFFAGNGFRDVDRGDMAKEEITFANAWGVCDQDLLRRVANEADRSFAAGRPFCSVVMTTSNHRPYTYPQVIDIPSGSGREGAVKYTDYALGEFLRSARTRPWFDNTVFIIVADHCASSAGKTEVPVDCYHIPMLVYAPKLIAPGQVDTLASQIDVAPTLLGLLNYSYRTRFFGQDLMRPAAGGRALMGNYQRLGLFDGSMLELLLPRKGSLAYHVAANDEQTICRENPKLRQDAVSFYQAAAYMIEHKLLKAD